MKVSDDLQTAWAASKAEASAAPGYYRRRVKDSGPLAVYAGIQIPEKARKISVRIPSRLHVSTELVHSTRGYDISKDEIDIEEPNTFSVCIRETMAAVPKDLFLIFGSDILEHLRRSEDTSTAVSALQSRLQHWKRFFQSRSDEGLSREEYVGLYAELEFLERGLARGIAAYGLTRGWSGPLGTNQDFLFGEVAVEVKATTGNDPDLVRITNVRQLDVTGLEQLYLAHCTYDFRRDAGRKLRDIVQVLRQSMAGNSEALSLFEERLSFAGFIEPEKSAFAEHGFSVRIRRDYKVDEHFPRILETALPHGISEVSYSLQLSSAAECKLNDDVLMNLLRTTL